MLNTQPINLWERNEMQMLTGASLNQIMVIKEYISCVMWQWCTIGFVGGKTEVNCVNYTISYEILFDKCFQQTYHRIYIAYNI